MRRLVAYRLLGIVPTLLIASVVIFVAINVVPGSAADAFLGHRPTPEARAAFEAQHGLDRPLPVQYVDWIVGVVRGDFGISYQNGVEIAPDLMARVPVTLELALLAGLIAVMIALPLGTLAAHFRGRMPDRATAVVSTLAVSTPNFWLASVLVLIFAITLRWVPPGGYVPFTEDPLRNLTLMLLPALSLGLVASGLATRIIRVSLLDVFSTDYIRTARSKGARERDIVFRHSMRNAIVPFLVVGGTEVAALFGGAVVIEQIFLLPGLGSMVLIGIGGRDFPVLAASVLLITAMVVVANLLVDLTTAALDPRRLES